MIALAPSRVTPPAVPVVTGADVMNHMTIEYDDDHALFDGFAEAAVDRLDGYTGLVGRALIDQVWAESFMCFVPFMRIRLGPNVQNVTVRYFDQDNAEQTVDPAVYRVHENARGPYVALVSGAHWPAVAVRDDAVTIQYQCGYGATPSDVPRPIRVAACEIAGALYQNREAAAPVQLHAVPLGVDALIAPYRRVGL